MKVLKSVLLASVSVLSVSAAQAEMIKMIEPMSLTDLIGNPGYSEKQVSACYTVDRELARMLRPSLKERMRTKNIKMFNDLILEKNADVKQPIEERKSASGRTKEELKEFYENMGCDKVLKISSVRIKVLTDDLLNSNSKILQRSNTMYDMIINMSPEDFKKFSDEILMDIDQTNK